MSLPANIYAKNLSHFGFGLPLYIPEPPPGQEPVRIGDVGYILDGCFYRLFNVTCTEDDPINSQGVPPYFEILPLEGEALHHVKKALPPSHVLHSTSVSAVQGDVDVAAGTSNAGGGLSYRFSCSEQEGALLVVKDHASSTQIHPQNNRFINYMRTHYMNWWVFANEKRGISLSPEDIVLVRGWTKTTQWAVAAKMRTSSVHELSFHADASFANATFSVGFSKSQSSSIMHRAGPDFDDLHEGEQRQDQCIFLGYFKLKRSSLFKHRVKIFAMAGPQDDDSSSPPPEADGWDSEDIETENAYQPHWDPLDEILDYILQNSQADVAIASHLSLRDLEWPKDNNIGSVLRECMPEIVVDALIQVGMLSAEKWELSPIPDSAGQVVRQHAASYPASTSPRMATPPVGGHNLTKAPRRPSAPPNNAANNNGTARRGLFSSMGQAPTDVYIGNQYSQEALQGRPDFNVGYGQSSWPSNPSPTLHQSQTGQFAQDPRYPTPKPNYVGGYPSCQSPPNPPNPQDSRTLPPLNTQGQFYPRAGIPGQHMAAQRSMRSQTAAGYPVQYGSYVAGQVQQQAAFYSASPDPRMVTSPAGGYDVTGGAGIPRRSSMSVDRTVPSRMSSHGIPPYALPTPSLSSEYGQESFAEQPIKKKRKRADAEQLKVLNETYNRTAFPSTEERIELAKKLGMSARSVQIWFQTKRQAMRKSSRQATDTSPSLVAESCTAGPASSASVAGPVSGEGADKRMPPFSTASISAYDYDMQHANTYRQTSTSPNHGRSKHQPTISASYKVGRGLHGRHASHSALLDIDGH